MIKLKNIVIDNNVAVCDIIVEDSNTCGKIEVDLEENTIKHYLLPTGYEWCKNHLNHAKEYLIEIARTKEGVPTEKTIMWC